MFLTPSRSLLLRLWLVNFRNLVKTPSLRACVTVFSSRTAMDSAILLFFKIDMFFSSNLKISYYTVIINIKIRVVAYFCGRKRKECCKRETKI